MDAPRMRIPERYQSGIAKLISLSDNAVEELLPILHETPHSLNLDTIKEYISSKVSLIPNDDIDEILSALDSLYYFKNESDIPLEEFSEQILQAIVEQGDKSLQADQTRHELLKDRLMKVMSGKLFNIVTKSRSVLYEQERTFRFARVLSDIRMVFEEEEANNPDAAVIVHTIKIHYVQNEQHKEFFVSLDTEDISFLIEALIHAQKKEDTLKAMLAAANVLYVDAE